MSQPDATPMLLTNNDKEFIRVTMSAHCQSHVDEICRSLAEVVSAQNNRMFKALDEQNQLIKEIRADVLSIKRRIDVIETRLDDKDIRLALLERSQAWNNIFIRIMISVVISVLIFLIVHYYFLR
jgi:hypothetical protein